MEDELKKKIDQILEENKNQKEIFIEDPEIFELIVNEFDTSLVNKAIRQCKKWVINPRTSKKFCIEYY